MNSFSSRLGSSCHLFLLRFKTIQNRMTDSDSRFFFFLYLSELVMTFWMLFVPQEGWRQKRAQENERRPDTIFVFLLLAAFHSIARFCPCMMSDDMTVKRLLFLCSAAAYDSTKEQKISLAITTDIFFLFFLLSWSIMSFLMLLAVI